MNFKEINNLRKQGDLKTAYSYAEENLRADPENIWNKRAIAWVYYGFLKANANPDNSDKFIKCLKKIGALQLPDDEKLIFDQSAWQIGKMVFQMVKHEPVDFKKINQIFDIIKDYHFSAPSKPYSFLHKAFLESFKNGWGSYVEFADWWGFQNFREEDYQKEELEDGTKAISLAERTYIAYSKQLLKNMQAAPDSPSPSYNGRMQEFLPWLNDILEKHPEFAYPPYYKAKLLLALENDQQKAREALLPFAKQNSSNYWVWDLMAETFSKDEENKLACFCKALSLNSPEDKLVKIRQKLAEVLIEQKYFNEARTEIEKLVNVRKGNGWKIPNPVQYWQEQDWYQKAKGKEDNQAFYKAYNRIAEELLYADIEEDSVVVEFVNQKKKILNFVKDRSKSGFFHYADYLGKPEIGDVLKVRLKPVGNEGYHKVLTLRKDDEKKEHPAIKDFEGPLKVMPPKNFGFVEDETKIFIPPEMVSNNNLEDNMNVVGTAILSYNKKRDEWGWKAIRIKPKTDN